jgi:Pyridoxamine 5'-phosphate oxidase
LGSVRCLPRIVFNESYRGSICYMVVLPNDIRLRIEAPHIWYVGTVNRDGSPHVSPMWVGLDGEMLLEPSRVRRVVGVEPFPAG